MDQFPPNSDASKRPQPEKRVEQITKGNVVRKKKGLGRQFKEDFLGGDLKTAWTYMVIDVALPAARDMIYESASAWFQKLIFGDGLRRRGATTPQAGPMGYVQYNRMSQQSQTGPQRAISRAGRSQHNFDEIVLDSRVEAEQVLERMSDVLDKFDVVTVADLYELVGINAAHTDGKWGWSNLTGAGVRHIREGYLLDLPEPLPLN